MKTTIENILNAAKLTKAAVFSARTYRLGYEVRETSSGATIKWHNPCAHGLECPCESGARKNREAIVTAISADDHFQITDFGIDWVSVKER